MSLEIQLLVALVLDMMIGDPRGYPHPVRLIGIFARFVESTLGRAMGRTKAAGILTSITVVAASSSVVFALIKSAAFFHPIVGDVVSCAIIYTCLSAKDLAVHAMRVQRHLKKSNYVCARQSVGMIVGRKTDSMSEEDICRATVESVAENLVDGVTAPLFFALLGGPVAVIAYKAASTMDSMFGYKNEKYLRFGWASARLDDVLNYIPARLTAPVIALAMIPMFSKSRCALHICFRDGDKHASPNSGISEAAFAGGLGISLGGACEYAHGVVKKPILGAGFESPNSGHIGKSISLMLRTTFLFAVFGLAVRLFVFPGVSLW